MEGEDAFPAPPLSSAASVKSRQNAADASKPIFRGTEEIEREGDLLIPFPFKHNQPRAVGPGSRQREKKERERGCERSSSK